MRLLSIWLQQHSPFQVLVAIATATLSVSACARLTDVSAPDVVQATDLDNAAGAAAIQAGAIGSFALAFAGGVNGLSQVSASGTMADEFTSAQAVQAVIEADRRVVDDPDRFNAYPYAAIQRARHDLRRAITALQQHAPIPASRIGELFALEAYTEVFLGENMCSGMPLSDVVDGNIAFGQPLNTAEMYERAISDFDSALSYGADSVRVANLARVGKGRALLDLGRYTEAASIVDAVETGYAYSVQYSMTVMPNGIYRQINTDQFLSVADQDGGNGLDFRSANDPRVQTVLVGVSSTGHDLYTFSKYGNGDAPVPLATGIEARLIDAEAALNDSGDWLATLNGLRSTVGLAPLSDPGSAAGRVDLMFRERAFWLFATGHRHGDLRRLVRQYQRPAESVFPTGTYADGQPYGSETTFAPDASQRGNPNYVACQNRTP